MVIACATRDIDVGCSVDVGPAARASRNLGEGIVVDDLVLFCLLTARMRAVAHEDTITESRLELFSLLHFVLRVW